MIGGALADGDLLEPDALGAAAPDRHPVVRGADVAQPHCLACERHQVPVAAVLGPDKGRAAKLPGAPPVYLERNRVAWGQAERG